MARAVTARPAESRQSEPRIVHVLTEPGPDGHRHCAAVDRAGNGKTSPGGADRHTHTVYQLAIWRSDDGHRHELSADRCACSHVGGVCMGAGC